MRAPEYWPRASVASLALFADEIILADTFQYSRQSYHNRARIRTPQGWQWLSVPLKGGQHGRPIFETEIEQRTDWRGIHLRSIAFNYRSSPYFDYYEPSISSLLAKPWAKLGQLTVETYLWTLNALKLDTPVRTASNDPDARFRIDRARAGTRAGVLVVEEDAAEHDMAFGTPLYVVSYREAVRRQNFAGFEPGMAALDLLFNYGPQSRNIIEANAGLKGIDR